MLIYIAHISRPHLRKINSCENQTNMGLQQEILYLVLDCGFLFRQGYSWGGVMEWVNSKLRSRGPTKHLRVHSGYYVHEVSDWEDEQRRSNKVSIRMSYDATLPVLGRGHLFELYEMDDDY